jgi:hypothetical protein
LVRFCFLIPRLVREMMAHRTLSFFKHFASLYALAAPPPPPIPAYERPQAHPSSFMARRSMSFCKLPISFPFTFRHHPSATIPLLPPYPILSHLRTPPPCDIPVRLTDCHDQ